MTGHHVGRWRLRRRVSPRTGGRQAMEILIGIALVVISALEMIGIVRVVSANLSIGR